MNPRSIPPKPNREAVAPSRPFVTRSPLRSFLLLCTLWGLSTAALACTIPVFRFALDRWEADPFRLVVPSAWVTQPDMIKLLVPLRGNAEANIKIEETSDPSVTEARLLFPLAHDPGNTALWSGPLNATTLPSLLDSPARQDLLRRILAGDSAIWVVCTTAPDKSEADRIEKRLRYLEQVAALPPQDPNDPDSQLGPGPPLKLKFSVLRLSLDDPSEKLFAAMVAGPKHQDFIANATSFAAPVFAKGRVLGAWPLSELDDTAIEDTSLFLIGRCSCRIKNENPGWDVILKADWERALAKADEESIPPSPPAATPSSAPARKNPKAAIPETRTIVPETKATSPAPISLEAYLENAPRIPIADIPPIETKPRFGIAPIAIGVLSLLAIAAALMLWFKR